MFLWPPAFDLLFGALGLGLALWSRRRRQRGRPVRPGMESADTGLMIFSAALLVIGLLRTADIISRAA